MREIAQCSAKPAAYFISSGCLYASNELPFNFNVKIGDALKYLKGFKDVTFPSVLVTDF